MKQLIIFSTRGFAEHRRDDILSLYFDIESLSRY